MAFNDQTQNTAELSSTPQAESPPSSPTATNPMTSTPGEILINPIRSEPDLNSPSAESATDELPPASAASPPPSTSSETTTTATTPSTGGTELLSEPATSSSSPASEGPPNNAESEPTSVPVPSSSSTSPLQTSVPSSSSTTPLSAAATTPSSDVESLSNAGSTPTSLSATSPTTSASPSISSSKIPTATTSLGASSGTTSAAAVTTSPAAQQSPGRSSEEIAAIAAPVAIFAVLIPVLVLFFCWWKRRQSSRGAYHHRNRSHDAEMSDISPNAREASHEQKVAAKQLDVVASSVPTISSTDPKQTETQTSPVGSTADPKMLPGLSRKLAVGSSSLPPGTSVFNPPSHLKADRQSDSPSLRLPDSIEPLDVTRSPGLAGPAKKPGSVHENTISADQASAIADEADWPLPSPFRSRSSERGSPKVSSFVSIEGKQARSSVGESSGHLLPRATSANGEEAVAGPSSRKLEFARVERHTGPSSSEPNLSRQSPFDDDNAHESASDYSTSIQDKRRVSSMLDLHGRGQIDDGVSEMTASSRGTDRKSRLHQRASDEISVVSSLHENG